MAALRLRVAGHAARGPGRALILMVALVCLTAGFFLGDVTRWAGATTAAAGVAQVQVGSATGDAAQQPIETAAADDVPVGVDARMAAVDEVLAAAAAAAAGDAAADAAADEAAPAAGAADSSAARVKSVCEDTCPLANNGVCDDGRATPGEEAAEIYSVHCDLGTDCGDCGPWVHNNTDETDSWRPIEEIRAKQFEVFARQVRHPTGFHMAFTDPTHDVDVSSALHHGGLLEVGFTWAWHLILREECQRPDGTQALVADVGANFGYYSLLAAAMGCRVVAWEPVPYFAAYFKYALLRNNMTHAVQLREKIVSDTSGQNLTIVVPNRGIWGTAGIGGKNIDGSIHNEGDYDNVVRPVERVDEVVAQDVLVMKVDVEGFEPSVLRGSRDLFLKHTVSHLFMEYSPGVPERRHEWDAFEANPTMLMGLVQAGYTILHLGDMQGPVPDWAGTQPLPEMGEVTQAALVNDIQDAWRLQAGVLGCHDAAQELGADASKLFNCGAIPEGFHPHSFRSIFGHNTNVWAFREKPWFATVGPPATLAPLDFDVQHEFFLPGGTVGAARRLCRDLPPEAMVAHRCPCAAQDVCGSVEQKVKQLAKEGQLPPLPFIDRSVEPEKLGIDTW